MKVIGIQSIKVSRIRVQRISEDFKDLQQSAIWIKIKFCILISDLIFNIYAKLKSHWIVKSRNIGLERLALMLLKEAY